MKKLIDAEALKQWLKENTDGEDEAVRQWFGSFARVLDRFPACADAAAVIRCRDCKFYKAECYGFGDDGYCSEAEKRRK